MKNLRKFNLFDITLMLLVLVCVVAVYVKITNPHITSKLLHKEFKTKDMLVTLALSPDANLIEDAIVIGDCQLDRFSVPELTVVKKDFREVKGQERLFVKIKVKAIIWPEGILTVRSTPLKRGRPFGFESKNVFFYGQIVEIDEM